MKISSAFQKCHMLIFFTLFCSCATIKGADISEEGLDQLRAENSLMKSTISLLKRENSVTRKENLEYRRQLEELKASVEKLNSDIESIKENHRKEIALKNSAYRALENQNKILQSESSARLSALMKSSKENESKLREQIITLNREKLELESAFNSEREALKKQFSEKEYEFTRSLEQINSSLSAAENEVKILRKKIQDTKETNSALRSEINSLRTRLGLPELEALEEKQAPANEATDMNTGKTESPGPPEDSLPLEENPEAETKSNQ